MPYCPRCGVEVDQSVHSCPLCETVIPLLDGVEGDERNLYPENSVQDEPYKMTNQTRFRYQMVISMIILIPVLVVISVDLSIENELTWSRYALVSLVSLWLFIIIPFMKSGIGKRWYISYAFVIAFMLTVFDTFDHMVTWSLQLAVPIVLSSTIILYLMGRAIARTKRKGYNIPGFILSAIVAGCLAIDSLTSYFRGSSILPGWSFIVGAALFPVAILMFYLHYHLKIELNMKRFFHL